MKNKPARPFVRINCACTVDGKLAPHTRRFVPFGSPRDQRLLFELRAQADAVMSGARTVDLGPVDLGPGPARYIRMRRHHGLADCHLRIVASASASLNPNAEIFRHRFSPIIILVSESASRRKVDILRTKADEVFVCGERGVDFVEAFGWLRKEWNVRHLLCEGGGELNAALFRQGVADEVYLTIAPLVFGGREAPTLADGDGIEEVCDATHLTLKSWKRTGNELYLVYQVRHDARRSA